MNFTGVIIGAGSFLLIGLFHPLVIKGEYYFSKRIWPLFLIVGLVFLGLSCLVSHEIVSALLGCAGFSSLWSIGELWQQEKRVQKGWFPKNEKRLKKEISSD